MLSSCSDTHESLLPSSSCCRILLCPCTSVSPGAGSVAVRASELTIPVWEAWSFFQPVILMTAGLSRENGEGETARKQTVLCWSPCKVSENHHPFCWKGHFQWKIVLSVFCFFFFCPVLSCEFLVPFLYAPALPRRLACCQDSQRVLLFCLVDPMYCRYAGRCHLERKGTCRQVLSNGVWEPGVEGCSSYSAQEVLHKHFQVKWLMDRKIAQRFFWMNERFSFLE